MDSSSEQHPASRGKKSRVAFRPNRQKPARRKDWTEQAEQAEENEIDARRSEHMSAKGDLSRHRTITIMDDAAAARAGLRQGTVVAMRGLYADVEDEHRVWPCTVRRILRTQLIDERHPVTVGDHVLFRVESEGAGKAEEGVIESVKPRRGQLKRRTGRRIQTIVANVDQAVIVSSAGEPSPKPHLIDRYIVASLAGDIEPVLCMNKMDLDQGGVGAELIERYAALGLNTLGTSVATGAGIDALRDVLKGKESVIAGQSGVGKSSMLNAVQPGLKLRTGDIVEQTQKGRHTTTTATLIRLDVGGYVVDTPGVKSFDLSVVPAHELEMYFGDLAVHVPNCKFPDCTHRHEGNCAVKAAVERGEIHPERYESYVRLFENPDVA